MGKKIVIIGGGIAGLAAGVYGRLNGYETEIYEMHSFSGGLCTGWKRKGYTFDGCIHWVMGSSPGNHFYRNWQEIGAFKEGEVLEYDEYMRLYDEDGEEFIFYTDIDRLCAELLRVGPEDEEMIGELRRLVVELAKAPLPTKIKEAMSFWENIGMMRGLLPYMKDITEYIKMPLEDFIDCFQSAGLRKILTTIISPVNCTFSFIYMLIMMNKRSAGWVKGGSFKFAQSIEERYSSLGGRIYFGRRVERVLTDKNRASGILLEDGTMVEADLIISAADGYSTIYKMLEGRYLNRDIEALYSKPELVVPFLQISIGVDRDLSGESHRRSYTMKPGTRLGKTEISELFMTNYSFDPTMAPAGKSSLVFLVNSPWEHWEGLEYKSQEYKEEKAAIERDIRAIIKEKLPELYDKIEVIDIATPHTTVRYTANWKSAFQGFLASPDIVAKPPAKTLPGLKQFYMVGQWASAGGGLPIVVQNGRGIMELICKKDNKEFMTEVKELEESLA